MFHKLTRQLFLLFWIYAICLLVMNLTPGSTQPLEMKKIMFVRMDYFFHCCAYFPLSVLYVTAAFSPRPVFRRHSRTGGIILMALLASVPEYLQNFVPLRRFNWWDMLANFTGLILGTLFSLLLVTVLRWKINFKSKQ